jgi:hypothetical protein
MSDRALWREEWCPTCRAAPGARCRTPWFRKTGPPTTLHVARGWRARPCPKCKAAAGEPCRTPAGRKARKFMRRGFGLVDGSWFRASRCGRSSRRAERRSRRFPPAVALAGVAISIGSRSVDSTATSWSTWSAGAAETSSAMRSRGRSGIASGPSQGSPRSQGPSCGRQQIGAW